MEQCFLKDHVDTSKCDDERCIPNETTPKSLVNDSGDEEISLLQNEEITNSIEENNRVSVVNLQPM